MCHYNIYSTIQTNIPLSFPCELDWKVLFLVRNQVIKQCNDLPGSEVGLAEEQGLEFWEGFQCLSVERSLLLPISLLAVYIFSHSILFLSGHVLG